MTLLRLAALLTLASSLGCVIPANAAVRVLKVDPAGAGARAGVQVGDLIESIQLAAAPDWIAVDSPLSLQAGSAVGNGPAGVRLRLRRQSAQLEPVMLPAGTLGLETEPESPEGTLWPQALRVLEAARAAEVDRANTLLHETLAVPTMAHSELPLAGWLMLETGKALYEASELRAAAALLDEAQRRIQQRWPRSRLNAQLHHALGLAQIYLGDTEAGSASFEAALAGSRASGDQFFEAVGIERRGFAQLWRYDNAAALESLTEALTQIRAIEPDGEFEIGTRMRLALLHRQTGELTTARNYAQSALTLIEARPPPQSAARVWFELGVIASMQYEVREAEQYHRKALTEVEAQQPHSPLRTYALNSLGYLKHLRGDYAGAQRYYAEALNTFEQRDAKPDLGMVLQNIAYNAIYAKDYENAEKAAQRALAIYKSADFGDKGLTPVWLILGQIALETGRIDLAQDRYRQVEALLKDAPQDSWDRWDLHYSHGLIDLERGQPDAALEDFERALTIARRRTPGTIYEALPAFDSGRAHEAAGRNEAAVRSYFVAIDAYEAAQRLLGGNLEDQGSFLARHARYYRQLIALLLTLERDEEAFAVLERYRSRLLLDLAVSGSGQLPIEVPAMLAARIAAEQTRHDRLLAELRDAKEGADRLLIALETSRAALGGLRTDWIATTSPARLASVGVTPPVSVPALRAALPADTALLSYAVVDESTYLLRLRRDGLRVVRLDIGAQALSEQVRALRRLLAATRPNAALRNAAVVAGHRLYEQLIAPAARDLDATTRLVILADGALHALPFAALVARPVSETSDRPQYLIDRFAVSTALSAQHYLTDVQRTRRSRPEASVALFARDQGQGRVPVDSEILRGAIPAALPYAREEAQAIGRLFGTRTQLLIGAEATESRAKALSTNVGILHFATHAVLDEAMPMDTYLVLDPGDSSDNGLLQAWEVAQFMRLDADLVTLAACDTLLGKDYGGGAQLGLHSAFMSAGARNVLGTLWSVSDRQTHALMLRFYEALAEGVPPDRALQIAQRAAADAAVDDAGPRAWLSRLQRVWREGLSAFEPSAGTHWTAFQLTGTGY